MKMVLFNFFPKTNHFWCVFCLYLVGCFCKAIIFILFVSTDLLHESIELKLIYFSAGFNLFICAKNNHVEYLSEFTSNITCAST